MERDTVFEGYFHKRADLADELAANGWHTESRILSTTALDALGAIWCKDFPGDEVALLAELKHAWGKSVSVRSSIRLSRMMQKFAPAAPHVYKVAVVSFALDWCRHSNSDAARRLLAPRIGGSGEHPREYLDVPLAELVAECPELSATPKLAAVAAEYEYPAMAYRFFRCPLVHASKSASRSHGFTRNEEVTYIPLQQGMAIGMGSGLFTRWLREAVTGYVDECARVAVRPGATIGDAAADAEQSLERMWKQTKDLEVGAEP